MKVTMIAIIIGPLGTVSPKDLKNWKSADEWKPTITVTIGKDTQKILENWDDLVSLRFQWKMSCIWCENKF